MDLTDWRPRTNEERAAFAKVGIDAYVKAANLFLRENEDEDRIISFLVSLMHYTRRAGLDFNHLLGRARAYRREDEYRLILTEWIPKHGYRMRPRRAIGLTEILSFIRAIPSLVLAGLVWLFIGYVGLAFVGVTARFIVWFIDPIFGYVDQSHFYVFAIFWLAFGAILLWQRTLLSWWYRLSWWYEERW